jgi:surface polysaccharide O-acyltransferase-like enzyme
MNTFNIFIGIIFVIKIIFIMLAITHVYLKIKGDENSKTYKNITFWKKRTEFIFILLMAILLIYLFNPISNKTNLIDKEAKILLYLFGIILLITSKWSEFIHESKWFKYIQKIM